MKPSSPGEAGHVQSVERALQLMELLARENREMSLTEISKAMNRPKSTVYGLLATLRGYRYIDQSPVTGRYRLGVRLFELGHLVARGWDVREAAKPVMQRLNTQTGEMVQLATEEQGEVLYLEKLDSTHILRIVSDTGARLPMHCTGLGKVLLAYKTDVEVKWVISCHGLPAMTPHTITRREKLFEELAKVRRQGYAIDDREVMEGLRCVAAPIWDGEGKVRYAISISALAHTLQAERLDSVIQLVKQAAAEISRSLGHIPESETP